MSFDYSSEFLGLRDRFYLLIRYYPKKGVVGELYYYFETYFKFAVFDYNYESDIKKYKLYIEFEEGYINLLIRNEKFVEEIINCFKEFVEESNLRFVDSYEKLRNCVIILANKLKEYILSFKEVIDVL